MKKILFLASLMFACIMTACNDNELPFDVEQSKDFSDIAFIGTYSTGTDDQWASYDYVVGKPISFMDLSPNTVSHSWTIGEGATFLTNQFTNFTTDFTPYLIPNQTVSTDPTVHVLLSKPGDSIKVTLRNTFKSPVFYEGYRSKESYPSPLASEAGLHVFDTTFVFNVCDSIGLDYKLYKNDSTTPLYTHKDREKTNLLSDSLSFPVLECEVGDYFRVEIDSTYGPVNSTAWRFTTRIYPSGYYYTLATQDVYTSGKGGEVVYTTTATAPHDTTSFNMGTIALSANLGPYPNQNKTIVLPYRVRVSVPDKSALVVRKASIKNMTMDSLDVTFNRPIEEYPANTALIAKDFRVILNNEAAGIENKELTVGGMTLSSDKRTFTIGLSEYVYENDVLTVEYLGPQSGYPLKDNYEFEAQPSASPITAGYFNPLALSGSPFKFDAYDNNVHCPIPFWGGNAESWSYFSLYLKSDYDLTSGCLRFNSPGKSISADQNFRCYIDKDKGFTINCPPGGNYYFVMKYKPIGDVEIANLMCWTKGLVYNFTEFPRYNDETAEKDANGWFTIKSEVKNFTAGYSENEDKPEFRIGLTTTSAARGLFFIDDLEMYFDCTRPVPSN